MLIDQFPDYKRMPNILGSDRKTLCITFINKKDLEDILKSTFASGFRLLLCFVIQVIDLNYIQEIPEKEGVHCFLIPQQIMVIGFKILQNKKKRVKRKEVISKINKGMKRQDWINCCDGCKKPDRRNIFKKCSRCKSVWYCSVECQRKAWKFHKTGCKI